MLYKPLPTGRLVASLGFNHEKYLSSNCDHSRKSTSSCVSPNSRSCMFWSSRYWETLGSSPIRLVDKISQNVHNVGNASDAVQALLVVKHPIVVPFLEEALKANHSVSSDVIWGLAEIGNEQSVRVLIPRLEIPTLRTLTSFKPGRLSLTSKRGLRIQPHSMW